MIRLNHALFDIRQYTTYVLCFCLLLIIPPVDAKDIIGSVEKVGIENANFSIDAKIDTGARNSSLNATNYHLSQKGKEKWIRFDVTNRDGKAITLEKQITRFAKIKRKEASTQQRPVIMLDICIGKLRKQVEVNLVNRSNFNYQMLIGRTVLHGNFIVDVQKRYTQNPSC